MNRIRFSFARIVAVALCVALLLPCRGAFAAEAEEYTCGDYHYVIQEDGTAEITLFVGDASSVTVPETLDGYAVTAIGDWVFCECYDLTEITLPDSLTTIGEATFSYCGSLTEITLPDSLTGIGDGAFSSCINLTEITLPDSLETIGSNPFVYSGVQRIHASADHPLFATVGGVLFSKPDKRLICYPPARKDTAYAVPEGTLAIGDQAFASCWNLMEIMLPDGLTAIGNRAFAPCGNLTEITLPNSLTTIGDEAFSQCEKLTEITLPDSLTAIGNEAFAYCNSFTEITLPDSVTAIGDGAFSHCDNLAEITLSGGLKTIGSNPFAGSAIQAFRVSPFHLFLATVDGVLFSKPDKRLICYPSARTDTAYAVPEGTPAIGDYAFGWNENLAEITLPDSVTAIGDHAFIWCENLTEITLPDSLTAIGNMAFGRCENLSSIIVGQDSCAMEYCVENDLPYSVRRK